MSKGFSKVSHSGHGGVDYYLRDGECLGFKDSKYQSKEEVLQNWLLIEKNEKLGNKDLGIRGRHDARVRTNYILSMPNSLSPEECLLRTENIIEKTPISKCSYTIVVHRGEKDGIKNQHVHLLVNERFLDSQKKDREMQRKEWLSKVFKPLYEQEFKMEFSQGATVVPRERITQALFEADRKKSREGIASYQRQAAPQNTSQKQHLMGDALLLTELKTFERLFVADQARTKEAAEQKAQAEAREREASRERALAREREASRERELAREREASRERELAKEREASRERELAKEREALKELEQKKISLSNLLAKKEEEAQTFAQEEPLEKENVSHLEKDFKPLLEKLLAEQSQKAKEEKEKKKEAPRIQKQKRL